MASLPKPLTDVKAVALIKEWKEFHDMPKTNKNVTKPDLVALMLIRLEIDPATGDVKERDTTWEEGKRHPGGASPDDDEIKALESVDKESLRRIAERYNAHVHIIDDFRRAPIAAKREALARVMEGQEGLPGHQWKRKLPSFRDKLPGVREAPRPPPAPAARPEPARAEPAPAAPLIKEKVWTTEELQDFDTIEHDGEEYGVNKRGDVVNADADYVGRYNFETEEIEFGGKMPDDLAEAIGYDGGPTTEIVESQAKPPQPPAPPAYEALGDVATKAVKGLPGGVLAPLEEEEEEELPAYEKLLRQQEELSKAFEADEEWSMTMYDGEEHLMNSRTGEAVDVHAVHWPARYRPGGIHPEAVPFFTWVGKITGPDKRSEYDYLNTDVEIPKDLEDLGVATDFMKRQREIEKAIAEKVKAWEATGEGERMEAERQAAFEKRRAEEKERERRFQEEKAARIAAEKAAAEEARKAEAAKRAVEREAESRRIEIADLRRELPEYARQVEDIADAIKKPMIPSAITSMGAVKYTGFTGRIKRLEKLLAEVEIARKMFADDKTEWNKYTPEQRSKYADYIYDGYRGLKGKLAMEGPLQDDLNTGRWPSDLEYGDTEAIKKEFKGDKWPKLLKAEIKRLEELRADKDKWREMVLKYQAAVRKGLEKKQARFRELTGEEPPGMARKSDFADFDEDAEPYEP